MRRIKFASIAVFSALLFPAAAPAAEQGRFLDPMNDPEGWKIVASDGVKLSIAAERDADGIKVLRLDYDFVSGAGYAGIRREWPEGEMPELTENYAFSFKVRGDLPPNNLEFKLTDAGAQNVWWVNRRAFKFSGDWQPVSYRKRHIVFAWGPSKEPLTRLGGVEFVVSSVNGGKGSVWLRDLRFAQLPPTRTSNEEPQAEAAPGSLTLDLRNEREFGGLALTWRRAGDTAGALPARAVVEFSDEPPGSGSAWRTAAEITGPLLDKSFVALPDSSARALRVRTLDPAGHPGAAPVGAEVRGLEFAATPNAFAKAEAAEYREGVFPKAILGKVQSNWTVLGVSGDEPEILFNEEGQIETRKGGPSLEPFVRLGGKLLTWADGTNTPRLEDGYLPVGIVERKYEAAPLTLEVKALVSGVPGGAAAWARYRLTNTGSETISPTLIVALRPFQVLPPWQQLNMTGGVAELGSIRHDSSTVTADGAVFKLLPAPAAFAAATAAQGDIGALLDAGREPLADEVKCPVSGASGAGLWTLTLEPGQSRDVAVAWPLGPSAAALPEAQSYEDASARFADVLRTTSDWWRAQLGRVSLKLPAAQQAVIDTARSQLAYIHINRDGAGIQPGSRSYERSWIRDGSMTSLSLLEFGQTEEAKAFVEWYAKYQFDSGKVPCVVDRRGPDPVAENDSHGQLIFAIANVYRFTRDKAFLERNFSHIERAVDYIKTLRAGMMTPQFSSSGVRREPGKPDVPLRAFYGLMPESISHEGYSSKPMHSYWDDFFTLRGLKDAADMAAALGREKQAKEWGALRDDFRKTLLASIAAVRKAHAIDYVPGCAELGDFDATSTAVAVTPCGELPFLPAAAVNATFDKYWDFFVRRRDDASYKWVDYTPYELRLIGAMVMLGHKDRAAEMLEWFMKDRLPAGFNHWAEIVHFDRTAPAWIGDMPHTWVGSDFLRSLRTMFLYGDEAAGSLHVFAGIPADWLGSRESIGFTGLATPYGKISAEVIAGDAGDTVKLSGDLRMAELPGGIVVHDPSGLPAASLRINGKAVKAAGETAVIRGLPAVVEFLSR